MDYPATVRVGERPASRVIHNRFPMDQEESHNILSQQNRRHFAPIHKTVRLSCFLLARHQQPCGPSNAENPHQAVSPFGVDTVSYFASKR
jgi:hypothetical protein